MIPLNRDCPGSSSTTGGWNNSRARGYGRYKKLLSRIALKSQIEQGGGKVSLPITIAIAVRVFRSSLFACLRIEPLGSTLIRKVLFSSLR